MNGPNGGSKREFLRLVNLASGSTAHQARSSLKRASRCQTQLFLFLGNSKPSLATGRGWRFALVSSLVM